jgi:hypothetical protein
MGFYIFQGRPSTFRVTDAVKELGRLTWLVKRYAGDYAPGDEVWIWRASSPGKPAGIVGRGVLSSTTIPMFSPKETRDFWVNPDEDNTRQDRVWIDVSECIGDESEVIQRDSLRELAGLESLLILKQPNGTNFRIDEVEHEILTDLWNGK